MKRLHVLAIMVILAAAVVSQAQTYTVKDLGTLGGCCNAATAINKYNIVAGGSTLAGDVQTNAYKWNSGKLTNLGTLDGGNGNSNSLAINSLNSVVGVSDAADGISTHAFLYTKSMVDLGTLGGATPGINSQANGINTAGFVVGYSFLSDFVTQHAFYWSPKTHSMTDLGTLPGGSTSSASAINNIGVIAGSSDNTSGATHATLWAVSSKGVVSSFDLGTLPNGTTSNAYAINDFLAVVGSADNTTTGNTDAFVWLGKMFDLGTLGGSFAQAQSVNNLGAIVGFSNTTGDADVHAFIWTVKKGMVDLNTLIPANSGWDLQSASSISDSGKIVGSGLFTDPVTGAVENHSFILTPLRASRAIQ